MKQNIRRYILFKIEKENGKTNKESYGLERERYNLTTCVT